MCTAVAGPPGMDARPSAHRPMVLCAAVLEMAARGHRRHRSGPPFGGGGPFGSFFAGGPGFPRWPRARRGDIRAAALLLLAEEPRNGYQIMQLIEERSRGVWRPSPGSVYPALAQLEDEGLVHLDEREGRRTYVLTDAGRAYVEQRREDLAAPWEEMSDSVDDDVASLFKEMRQVGMAAGQIGQMGSARQVTAARGVLANARRALYALLAEDEPDP